jgi:hypothetical protein
MNRKRTATVGVVAFVCGAISFFNARSTALSGPEPRQWLSKASNSVVELDDEFSEELAGLITNLMNRQKSLGSVLEDPCAPDEVVLEQAENVVAAHEHLTRRSGEHVVALRGKLPVGNRQQLMRLCAETFRGPLCRLPGPGGGRGMRNGTGGGMGNGMGYGRHGAGRGPGAGRGMRHGVCKRLANCLRLDEGQVSLMHEKDPGFETDTADLRNVLLAERATLLSMFEDPESRDDQLLEQIEKLVTAHSGIERRIIRHVLVLRPYLTVEQQKWLIGLCRRSQDNS